jgi:predicted enzyme related to lactoylglutathione lyase
MAHKVVWFDLPVQDLDRARKFYGKVLDLEFEEIPAEVPMAVMHHGPGEVAGCLFRHEGFEPSRQGPMLYFAAAGRLDEAVSLVEDCGGQVLQGVHEIGPFGKRAIVLDSEGNRIALHSE